MTEVLARPAAQQPAWPDAEAVRAAVTVLRSAPPLVTPDETDRLRGRLAAVARGEALLLQSGDCAETFAGNTESHVDATLRCLLDMAGVLARRGGLPVVTVGRVGGQYAKPRSAPTDALGLPVYRGDIVNSFEPDPVARTADPRRMVLAHTHAAMAMNRVRALARTGKEVFSSHEAMLLDYEGALLRPGGDGDQGALYSGSAHFLWIGERTRQLDGAHIGFAEQLANPVGLKVGPGTTPEEAVEYARRLDPDRVPGRLTLISRMGRGRVRDALPPLVAAVRAAGHPVVWSCDPMHGNTCESPSGYKTRLVEDVLDELRGFFEVHAELGTHPGGLHLEATGEDVTECLDGASADDDASLVARYDSLCDPRLNSSQAHRVADAVGGLLHDHRGGSRG
ncbi:3-deoxy-7-phosphoheptulonate synthase [Streptomyces sp. NBC_00102]|uniref:3-deoxy-7-phosphoheptulonate synthase n=1 Tax=Streptomyces sp. NBC_00102 TaxID=2975652 RepID=UPI0022578996|nr:3-deoxy-7-phosphoheptulonate synthase class II [Streptomyces sp. NBC_00102]MCX5399869.1 3-deoxy-7-phosphoheptulonate synthase [Streptomyces sp. NBC_00102]